MQKKYGMVMKENSKARFSLRKLSIGMCSVFLGLLFVEVMGQEVKADSVQHNAEKTSITFVSDSKHATPSNNDEENIKRSSSLDKSLNKESISINQNNTSNVQSNNVLNSNSLQNNYGSVQRQQNEKIDINIAQRIKALSSTSVNLDKDEASQAILTSFYVTPSSSHWHKVGSNWTFSKKDGTRAESEWVYAPDKKWYYFDYNGNMAANGWVNTYYNGSMKNYYFDNNGHYSSNTWHRVAGNWTFSKKDGTRAESEWVYAPDKKWYYFDYNGNMAANGWINTYYNGSMKNYYFDNNGHYSSNAWHRVAGNWTFSKKDGTRAESEWVYAPDKKWYYFDYNGNMAANGWIDTYYNGSWKTYYFDNNGHYMH